MKLASILTALSLAIFVPGCGPYRPGPIEITETNYSKEIKESVAGFVRSAKENIKTVGPQAEIFLEKLQGYSQRPVGANKDVYEQLVQKCKEVADTAKKSGDVRKKLDEMAALANKLPG